MRVRTKVLRGVRPNVGLELQYRKKLVRLLEAMHKSVLAQVTRCYRKVPPKLAQDELAAVELDQVMRQLSRLWLQRFDALSPKLAAYFAQSADDRVTEALKHMLRESGIAVEFKLTTATRDILRATIAQNVGLIRSIPQQYLLDVQGLVMRSVQVGRDLGSLTKELQGKYGVAYKRAAFIARDQNNKATAAINRNRQVEAGLVHNQWMHSHAGKTPRPSHVKAGHDKVVYEVAKGWYDPHEGRFIQPGELPGCRCYSRPLLSVLSP